MKTLLALVISLGVQQFINPATHAGRTVTDPPCNGFVYANATFLNEAVTRQLAKTVTVLGEEGVVYAVVWQSKDSTTLYVSAFNKLSKLTKNIPLAVLTINKRPVLIYTGAERLLTVDAQYKNCLIQTLKPLLTDDLTTKPNPNVITTYDPPEYKIHVLNTGDVSVDNTVFGYDLRHILN